MHLIERLEQVLEKSGRSVSIYGDRVVWQLSATCPGNKTESSFTRWMVQLIESDPVSASASEGDIDYSAHDLKQAIEGALRKLEEVESADK